MERSALLTRAERLEYVTVGWNLVEGVVAVAAAAHADSVALLGFGLDSFVESASGLILLWRLRAERRGATDVSGIDRRALRAVGITLFVLAAWVAFDAVSTLVTAEVPRTSTVGLVLVSVSLLVMLWLARAKLRTARALGSRALEADAFQTTACWWLSLATLAGVGLNALFGWSWADPVAAIGIAVLLVREGREAWRGEGCC